MKTHENKIELHYWLNDQSHSMDAYILNKSEWEILQLVKEASEAIGISVHIESQAISEGGVKKWFKIILKNENKKATISTQVMTTVIVSILTATSTIFVNNALSDPEVVQLTKKNLEADLRVKEESIINTNSETELLELQKEKTALEIKLYRQKIAENLKVAKRVSNFYEEISKEHKVSRISINSFDNDDNLYDEAVVSRSEFPNFILSSDDLETIIDEEAVIEIISPVLKKGNYLWRGAYNGAILNFNMRSTEFKTLVQTGEIEFKSGTCILCILEMTRKINNLGEEIVTAYNINKVISYYNSIGEEKSETPEGRKYRRKKEADEQQLDLFGQNEE